VVGGINNWRTPRIAVKTDMIKDSHVITSAKSIIKKSFVMFMLFIVKMQNNHNSCILKLKKPSRRMAF